MSMAALMAATLAPALTGQVLSGKVGTLTAPGLLNPPGVGAGGVGVSPPGVGAGGVGVGVTGAGVGVGVGGSMVGGGPTGPGVGPDIPGAGGAGGEGFSLPPPHPKATT